MAYIDYTVFDIYDECDILTNVCTINVGDIIRVGGYAFWSENYPMEGITVILCFSSGGVAHEVWLSGITNADGWFAANHTVTAEDIADFGTSGFIYLCTYSDPEAYGNSKAVNYVQPTTPTPTPVPPYLYVTPLSRNSPAAGETFTITIESNISWTAVDDVSWVYLSPTSGTGNGTVSATVNANPGTTSRTWHATIAGDDESRTRTYTQSGAPTPTPTPTPTPSELLYTTGTYQIERTEEANLLYTTGTYQIERTEEANLLYTTGTYQIERTEEANLLYTTGTYQIERTEEMNLLYTTPTYQIERTEGIEGLLYTTPTFQIKRPLSVIECLFLRLSTGKPLPRVDQQNPVPRVTCMAEAITGEWEKEKPWWVG